MTKMEKRFPTSGLILTILAVIFAPTFAQKVPGGPIPTHGKVVACYFPSWVTSESESQLYSIDNTRGDFCTHVIYYAAGLNASTASVVSRTPKIDLSDNGGSNGYRRTAALRDKFPGLKVTLSIGGWSQSGSEYSKIAASPEKRRIFVKNVVDYVTKFNFEGADLDWEFPGDATGGSYDKRNLVLLAKELNHALKSRGLLLTAQLAADIPTMESAYDFPELSKYLDYMHLLSYGYHGSWDRKVLSSAPLGHTRDQRSVEDAINYMLNNGASPEKLVLGLPTFGYSYAMKYPIFSPNQSPIGRDTLEQSWQAYLPNKPGVIRYNQVCTLLSDSKSGWRGGWDEASSTPWAVKQDRAISYDDPKSLMLKVDYAMKKKLAGVMIWRNENDDYKGNCSALNAAIDPSLGADYPLFKAINMALAKKPKSDNEYRYDWDRPESPIGFDFGSERNGGGGYAWTKPKVHNWFDRIDNWRNPFKDEWRK